MSYGNTFAESLAHITPNECDAGTPIQFLFLIVILP